MRYVQWLSAAALTAGFCSASFAQISGKVTLQGTPPEMPEIKVIATNPQCAQLHKDPVYDDSIIVGDKGELDNVVVSLKAAEGQKLAGPQKTDAVVLDQKGCMYDPHVLAVQTGQPVVLKNSDPFLHNVHSMAIDNAMFNFAQIGAGEKKIEPFTAVEIFQIKCDVHPWMKAVAWVSDNPYFAKTGEDGKYTIDTKGLKDGTYTIVAWQEKYHNSEPQQVEIKDGKATKEIDFVFKSDAKTEAKPLKELHLASIGGTPACCATKVAASN